MNKFELIKEQLSKILDLKNDLIFTVPWIQPVKIDDYTIDQEYKFIITKSYISFLLILLKSFKEIFISLSKIVRSIFIKNKSKNELKKANVIILSHLIDQNIINKNNDFYFGELEDNLSEKGYTTQKLYLNHIPINKNLSSNKQTLILPKIDKFSLEVKVLKKQFSLFVYSLKNLGFLYRSKVKLSVLIIFLIKIFSSHTQSALRIGIQISEFINLFSTKYLFITFEGYCYEKSICILNKKSKIISYQNTPINISQFSLKYFNNSSLPDIILSKNKFYMDYLQNYISSKCKLINFGDLNFNKKTYFSKKQNLNTILFIPEGNKYEVNLMVKFINKNYFRNKNLKFTIRFHPIFPKKMILKYKSIFINSQNVFFSDDTINNDFNSNSFVFYRGSSLVFEAIKAGLIPLYLNKGINIDILKILNIKVNHCDFTQNLSEFSLNKFSHNNNIQKKIEQMFYPANLNLLYDELQ